MARLFQASAIVLAVMFAGTIAFRWYLYDAYAQTRPREPVPNAGRLFPLNNHGTIVYLTGSEDRLLTVTFYAQFAFGIAAGLLFERSRQRQGSE